jgi:tight adherence protein C
MVLIALLGLLSLSVAVVFGFRAASASRVRTAENIEKIDTYGYVGGRTMDVTGTAPAETTLASLAAVVGEAASRRFNSLRLDEIQRRLIAAGYYTVGPRRYVGYQVLLSLALPIALIWLFALAGAGTGVIVFFALFGLALGWVIPSFYLSRRASERLERVDEDLPELIDLLVVTIEAGVGFTASLRMAADRLGGPLGDELRLTIQEQNLGLSTLEALENWLSRCDTPGVRSFVRAMIQGERLGVSIGQIMRNLALEMRKRRRQKAEERAQKAPIKILFPLVFLIFPAMFVIVLGPAMYTIADTFSGK